MALGATMRADVTSREVGLPIGAMFCRAAMLAFTVKAFILTMSVILFGTMICDGGGKAGMDGWTPCGERL